jgi:broad specificity phosphatase PhoE
MTSVYLFRHAQTDFRRELIGGRSNYVPITEVGRMQSEKLGLWIARNNLFPDFIAVSPAVRTLATAAIALRAANIDLQFVVEDRLQELTKGAAEGQPRATVNTAEILERMVQEGNDFKYDNGESNTEAADRSDGWLSEVVANKPDQTIFGFTHGIVTRCLIAKYLGLTYDELNNTVLDNASATIVRFAGQQLEDIQFNVDTQG